MEDEYWPIKKFISFNYQYYVFGSINQIVHKSKFNWPDFLVNMIRNSIDMFMETNYVLSEDYSQCTLGRVSYTRRFLEAVLSIDEQHENIQIFIDKYSKLLIEYERVISLHVHEIPEDENYD